jgi:hypothetical protein
LETLRDIFNPRCLRGPNTYSRFDELRLLNLGFCQVRYGWTGSQDIF